MPIVDIVIPEEVGDVEECVIVTWLKREGDTVAKGEELLIVQAEKVSFEIPAPATGKLTNILAQQGEVVTKDRVLAQIAATVVEEITPPLPVKMERAQTTPLVPRRDVRASPAAKRLAREHGIDLTEVPGSGAEGRITEKDVQTFIETRQTRPEAAPAPAREVRASPVAKRLAREHNIDLSQVTGTGGGGRITEKDVRLFIDPARSAERAAPPSPPAEAEKAVPMVGMRATIAQRMHQSLQSMAQATLHTEADVTVLVTLREKLKQSAPLTYTDLIVRACALALRQHPRLNATLEGEAIRLLPQVNVGVAVALDDGLIVPVIRDADRQKLAGLTRSRTRLAERARAGRLTQSEIGGGTFTVTNLGVYDIDAFTPIINPPEAAILGIGRIVDKVVIHQGKIAQRSMMTLSLTFDHRLVDGAPAAAFLQTVKQMLENPDEAKLGE